MKKFSLLPGLVLTASVVLVFLISCQKEQAAAPVEPVQAASENIVGIAGSGSYPGSINPSYAAALAANYVKKYGDDDDQTQSVAFSAKDLIAFISGLKTKYKSDIIYVNFGVYGRGALPLKSKDYGRLTVFFTGDKISSANNGRKTDGNDTTVLSDVFLNHGQIFP
jgi:hypothetical protein